MNRVEKTMARWDHLPEITKDDLKRLYHVRKEQDFGGYASFDEFCQAEYERTARSINRILFDAGRRSPLTKKRVKLKEERKAVRTIHDKFRAKFETWRSVTPSRLLNECDVPSHVRELASDDSRDVSRFACDVPRPSRNAVETQKQLKLNETKGLSSIQIRNCKGREGHHSQKQLKADINGDPFQAEISSRVSLEVPETIGEDAVSGFKSVNQSLSRSHPADTPTGEHSEHDQGLTDDDPYWPFTKEEWEAKRQGLGTFRGRYP